MGGAFEELFTFLDVNGKRGILKFGFGRNGPLQSLKVDHTITNFSKKKNIHIYQSVQF